MTMTADKFFEVPYFGWFDDNAGSVDPVVIPGVIEVVETAGFAKGGDGGAARYSVELADPGTEVPASAKKKITTASGDRWLVLMMQELNPLMFGGSLDGVTPNGQAWNDACQFANWIMGQSGGAGFSRLPLDGMGGTFAIDMPVAVQPNGLRLKNAFFYAITDTGFNSTNGVLTITDGSGLECEDIFVDCGATRDVPLENVQGIYCTRKGFIRFTKTNVSHWGVNGNGFVFDGGSVICIDCVSEEWRTSDPGVSDPTNRHGYCYKITNGGGVFFDASCQANFGDAGLFVDENSTNVVWDGGTILNYKDVDSAAAKIYGTNVRFINPQLNSCSVFWYSRSGVNAASIDGEFLNGELTLTFPTADIPAMVVVDSDQANTDLGNFRVILNPRITSGHKLMMLRGTGSYAGLTTEQITAINSTGQMLVFPGDEMLVVGGGRFFGDVNMMASGAIVRALVGSIAGLASSVVYDRSSYAGHNVWGNNTSGDITITLPNDATPGDGFWVTQYRSHQITLSPASGATLNAGTADIVVPTQFTRHMVWVVNNPDGSSAWWVMS